MDPNPPTPEGRPPLLAGSPQPGESPEAIQACNDWLLLGPGRTLPRLLLAWAKIDQYEPPTRSLKTLKHWSARFHWAARRERVDAAQVAPAHAAQADATAQQHEAVIAVARIEAAARVAELDRLATFLAAQIYEQGETADGERVYHNVWLYDCKQIGSGPFATQVDLRRFNGPLIDQYRGVLDDIAKEVGGRKLSGPEVPPPPPREAGLDLAQLTDDELALFHQLARKAAARNGV
jgi:hypothetical protein